MPSAQRGRLRKRHGSWHAGWYDESGREREKGGFATKTEAGDFLDGKLDEVRQLRRGGAAVPARERPQTIDALLDLFLEKHGARVDPATKKNLTTQLRKARAEFGDRHPGSLRRLEIEDWRETLPAGSRHGVFRAFRQALAWAHARELVTGNPAQAIKNPKRGRHERREIIPFESWDEVRAIADELDERYRAIPIVAVGTGLRPEELFGLNRGDVDRKARLLRVRRRFTGCELKAGGKTAGSVREVPLRQLVLDALDDLPTAIRPDDALFTAPRGGRIDISKFRHREWAPALRAAGIQHRRIYDCRHTFATWSIESDIHLSYLAAIMGTSVHEIEDTYARWLKRTDDRIRAIFDAYDTRVAAGAGS